MYFEYLKFVLKLLTDRNINFKLKTTNPDWLVLDL